MSVGIIASAAYVNPEMAVEFGRLPPSFLPAGNARLFVRQVQLLQRLAGRVVLTLPEGFSIAAHDARLLRNLSVEVVRIAEGVSLAESLMLALIQSVEGDEAAVLLHGDTLFIGMESFPWDAFSVHAENHPYPWAVVESRAPVKVRSVEDGLCAEQPIVSGLFSFSRGVDFLRSLARTRDFLAALNDYAACVPDFHPVENCGLWLDLGHLNTYYETRRTLTTERTFNTLAISRNIVCKTSTQCEKMEAEASWYEALPSKLKPYVPVYLGRLNSPLTSHGYSLSYEYLCPLSDLYVFGALPAPVWQRIFASCRDVLSLLRTAKPNSVREAWFTHLYNGKAVARFEAFARSAGIETGRAWSINGEVLPPPTDIIERMAEIIGPPVMEDAGILHGDFCLSNILFDFRQGSVKLVDPRGYTEPGTPELFGDTRYDLGKLHHSVVGGYDMIVAGYYDLRQDAPYTLTFEIGTIPERHRLEKLFIDIVCEGDEKRVRVAAAISVLLFFSMLPLHGDNQQRQWAFLANGYRLYRSCFGRAA
ncbi:MAG: hypothetical protein JO056_05605 [Alphaproteobacteria bacterium]|nr:hypothetical protein [Alphaproteobacteria bacterium]